VTDSAPAAGSGAAARSTIRLLSASFFASSGFGLLLLVAVARWLSPEENAHFQAVWGLIFAFASVMGALEQEVTRRATTAHLDGHPVPVGVVQAEMLAAVACVAILGVLVATPQGRMVVQGSVVIVVLTLFSMLNFVVLILSRGVLLGGHAIGAYAGLLAGEGALRLVILGGLLVIGVEGSVTWAVFATVAGSLVWVLVVARVAHVIDWSSGRDPWGSVGGTVAALATANGLSALVLTGFPTVAAAIVGDAADLAVLFAVITLARAPLALLAPVQALTVPTVVRWSRDGDTHRLSRALVLIAGGSAASALLGAMVGYVIGPWAVALVLGADYRPGPVMAALVAGATCVMAGALLQAAALVALQRYWQLTTCWAVAIAGAALVMLAAPWSAEDRGLCGFTVASLLAFVATAVAVRRTVPTAGSGLASAGH
jgi:O-antigen/teichoic acid export membrane protein